MVEERNRQSAGASPDRAGSAFDPPMPAYPEVLAQAVPVPQTPAGASAQGRARDPRGAAPYRLQSRACALAAAGLVMLVIPGTLAAVALAAASTAMVARACVATRSRPGGLGSLALAASAAVLALAVLRAMAG